MRLSLACTCLMSALLVCLHPAACPPAVPPPPRKQDSPGAGGDQAGVGGGTGADCEAQAQPGQGAGEEREAAGRPGSGRGTRALRVSIAALHAASCKPTTESPNTLKGPRPNLPASPRPPPLPQVKFSDRMTKMEAKMYAIGNGTGAPGLAGLAGCGHKQLDSGVRACSAARLSGRQGERAAGSRVHGAATPSHHIPPSCHRPPFAAAGAKKLGQVLSMKGRSSSRDREGSDTSSAQPSPVL